MGGFKADPYLRKDARVCVFGSRLSKSTVAFVKVSGAFYFRVASSFPSLLGSIRLYLHQAA